MQCETCPNLSGFRYRERILCSTCIDKIVQAANQKRYEEALALRKIEREKQQVKECEICGKVAVTQFGFSDLCEQCAINVDACQHQDCEVTESLEDNFIVTRNLCRDCGVRF
jgi:hypothetical protein